jgi:hypothetical protein
MEDRWFGLVEVVFTVVVVGWWYWRDRRGLERDIAARKAREDAARTSTPDEIRPPPA